ncbi:MAG: ATP-dependent helicase, partial [Dehalococcoidia bacterium]
MDMLAGLNPAQREAVLVTEGPLLILAGPGSGKTRVIAHRIAHLVADCAVPPRRIVAVTFTNKAAREMRERVLALLGPPAQELALGTFHAICSRILRIDGGSIGIDRGFTIYDDDDQIRLVKSALRELSLDPQRVNPRAVLSVISRAKSELTSQEAYAQAAGEYFQEVVARVFKVYQRLLQENRALDFDDLITRTVELFRVDQAALDKYRQRYLHVLVDEFQDTNISQYVLTRQLAAGHGNICVVGDPDQSIYAWRSADVRNILNFEKDFAGARVVYLEQNYRSTQTILDSAQNVISANSRRKEKGLWTENGQGQPVTLLVGADEQEEARLLVSEIERTTKRGRRPGDFAIMYRTNAQSRAIEEALVNRRIPYRLVGGTRFYNRKEVKDILAYLRAINNPFDSISLMRVINVPPRGIGARSLDDLLNWAHDQKLPVYSALQMLDARERGEEAPIARPPFQTRTTTVLLRFLHLFNDLIERAESEPLTDLVAHLLEVTEYRSFLT